MKKHWLIPICIVAAILLLGLSAILYINANSLDFSTGRVLIAENGRYILIEGNSPIAMSNPKDKANLFKGLENGDVVLVIHGATAESYPGRTSAYAIFKLKDGDISDIPAEVLTSLTELGWWDGVDHTGLEMLPETIPEDFSFALTWGTYGISSYDSENGKLVKTTDATHPENYVTTYQLTEENEKKIYDILSGLNLNSYPDSYDPINDPESELRTMSDPSMTLILTVRTGTWTKTIACRDIAMQYSGYDDASNAFLAACKEIQTILTATEEWKALPDYEYLYS